MKRFLFGLTLLMLATLNTWAVRAIPFPIDYTQPDGTTVTVRLHGNEHFHYMTTLDGILVVNTGKGIYVARITEDNELEATDVLAHNADMQTPEESALAAKQDKESFIKKGYMQEEALLAKPSIPQQSVKLFPHTSTPKVLVMLVDFTDKSFSVGEPLKNFDQSLNKRGHGKGTFQNFKNENGVSFHEDHIYGSVSEYFECMSYGQFRPQFDIVPNIIHLKNDVSYYGKSENMNALVKDACTIAKNDYNVDFSKYDSDNDGYCDLVYFIFAGQGENSGGAAETIWAKSGTIYGTLIMDEKRICRYGVSCELGGLKKYIDGIGVFCHEFSHTMGLPDFYNTADTQSAMSNQGMEYWSVLDWGMYLNDGLGSCPCPYTAWERYYMGWIDIPTIETNGHYKLYPYYANNHNAYIIENPDNSNEYLVLENIRKSEWGEGLYGEGLQVTHANFESSYFSLSPNRVNTVNKHPRMTIIPADGDLFSTNNDVSIDDFRNKASKDLFSQANGCTELSRESNLPNFDWFTNAENKTVSETSPTYPNYTKIYNIQENEDGSIEFDVILDTTTGTKDATFYRNHSGKIYNLNGQQVRKGYKGITIKNGRKVFAPVL